MVQRFCVYHFLTSRFSGNQQDRPRPRSRPQHEGIPWLRRSDSGTWTLGARERWWPGDPRNIWAQKQIGPNKNVEYNQKLSYVNTHRIHGAGIYANIGGILMGSMLPYIAAPWILWDMVVPMFLKVPYSSWTHHRKGVVCCLLRLDGKPEESRELLRGRKIQKFLERNMLAKYV